MRGEDAGAACLRVFNDSKFSRRILHEIQRNNQAIVMFVTALTSKRHIYFYIWQIESKQKGIGGVSCRRCNSDREAILDAEVNFHSVGLGNLNNPAVLLFPTTTVCLDCGFVEFNLAEGELKQIVAISHEAA